MQTNAVFMRALAVTQRSASLLIGEGTRKSVTLLFFVVLTLVGRLGVFRLTLDDRRHWRFRRKRRLALMPIGCLLVGIG